MIRMHHLFRGRWGKVILVVGSLIVALVAAEIVLRVSSIGYGGVPNDGHPILHHTNPPNYTYTVHNIWGEFGGHNIYFDENGFRVPEYGPQYDISLPEIVFLGDSFVAATQVPYEKTFVGLFDQNFANVNTRNFGVPSYSPLLSYLQLKHYRNTIKPVVVVHLIFENDLEDDRTYFDLAEKQNDIVNAVPGDSHSLLYRLARLSYVARLVRRAQITANVLAGQYLTENEETTSSYYLENPKLDNITTKYIEEIFKLSKKENFLYVLMCVPSKLKFNESQIHKDICEKIKNFSKRLDIEYIDLDEYFSQHADGRKPFYDRNIHFNEVGNILTYQAIEEYFKSNPEAIPPVQSSDPVKTGGE